MHETQTLFNPS
jgi:hypothetical protein